MTNSKPTNSAARITGVSDSRSRKTIKPKPMATITWTTFSTGADSIKKGRH